MKLWNGRPCRPQAMCVGGPYPGPSTLAGRRAGPFGPEDVGVRDCNYWKSRLKTSRWQRAWQCDATRALSKPNSLAHHGWPVMERLRETPGLPSQRLSPAPATDAAHFVCVVRYVLDQMAMSLPSVHANQRPSAATATLVLGASFWMMSPLVASITSAPDFGSLKIK